MNWDDTGYEYDVSVVVVHQTNIDAVLGSLKNVKVDSISITENYYSDSRIQAKVETVTKIGESDGYVANGRLRIILTIPEIVGSPELYFEHGIINVVNDSDIIDTEDEFYGGVIRNIHKTQWSEELITGYVSDIHEKEEHGCIIRSYTIEGTMWGLLNHKTNKQITIGKGTYLVNIWTSLMKLTKMQYVTSNAQNHKFGSTVIYEAGDTLSTILFEVSSGYNRMDNNGHGAIVLERYVSPANQTPSKTIDSDDVHGLSIAPYEHGRNDWENPGRAVVTATTQVIKKGKTTQKVIVGYYDAPSTDKTSINTRGYLIGRTDTYVGTSKNPTKSELNAVAKTNWQNAQKDTGGEWTFSSIFRDYHAGDVVNFIAPGDPKNPKRTVHKCLISSVNTNLGEMSQSLTLKEV